MIDRSVVFPSPVLISWFSWYFMDGILFSVLTIYTIGLFLLQLFSFYAVVIFQLTLCMFSCFFFLCFFFLDSCWFCISQVLPFPFIVCVLLFTLSG